MKHFVVTIKIGAYVSFTSSVRDDIDGLMKTVESIGSQAYRAWACSEYNPNNNGEPVKATITIKTPFDTITRTAYESGDDTVKGMCLFVSALFH